MFRLLARLSFIGLILPLVFACRPLNNNNNQNGNDIANEVLDYLKYVPPDFEGAAQGVIINTINQNLASAFGGTLKAVAYPAAGHGMIVCPENLLCEDFDASCRWRNVREDGELQWYQGQGQADPQKWENLMATKDQPKEPFALVASQEGTKYQAWLVSDPIPEQPGDGVVKFKFWMTPFVQMKVCTRQPNTNTLVNCSKTIESYQLPGPISVRIPGPIRQQFEIVIAILNFVTKPGGVGALDDISYQSDLCATDGTTTSSSSSTRSAAGATSKTTTRRNQDNEQTTTQQRRNTDSVTNSGRNVAAGSVCSAVPCDFEAGPCNYNLNPTSDAPASFRVKRGKTGNPLTGITRDRNGRSDFNEPYLVAQGTNEAAPESAIAASAPFTVTDTQVLKFYRYQGSVNTALKVCIDDTSNCLRTFDTIARKWQAETVDLPPSDTPSKLLFVADNLSPTSYIAIDEIQIVSNSDNSLSAC